MTAPRTASELIEAGACSVRCPLTATGRPGFSPALLAEQGAASKENDQ